MINRFNIYNRSKRALELALNEINTCQEKRQMIFIDLKFAAQDI